jgi:nitroreductase
MTARVCHRRQLHRRHGALGPGPPGPARPGPADAATAHGQRRLTMATELAAYAARLELARDEAWIPAQPTGWELRRDFRYRRTTLRRNQGDRAERDGDALAVACLAERACTGLQAGFRPGGRPGDARRAVPELLVGARPRRPLPRQRAALGVLGGRMHP